MPRDIDEKALHERFSKGYQLIKSDLLRQLERSNCGCDYGATSFTTLEQVYELITKLNLEPNKRLLEVGAGSGWPGLYMAKETGCDVTFTDLPIEGLQVAKQRAAKDNLTDLSRMVVASGSALPFRNNWFHAVSHSDVLCCLVDKLSVLKACREVVHPHGVMVFSVILISPNLSQADYREAAELGPSFMASDDTYTHLFGQSGWDLRNHVDLSKQFMETLQVKLNNEINHADDLKRLLGKVETDIRLTRTQAYINGLERGLTRRESFEVVPA